VQVIMIDRHERIRNRPRFSNADLNLRRHTQTKNATHQDALVTQQQVCSFDTTSDGVGMHVGELDAWLPLHTPHVSPLRFARARTSHGPTTPCPVRGGGYCSLAACKHKVRKPKAARDLLTLLTTTLVL